MRGMKRILLVLVVASATCLGGCNRTSEAECRKAVENIDRIYGRTEDPGQLDPQAAIRACRGRDTKKKVKCMIDAKTVADLEACEGAKK